MRLAMWSGPRTVSTAMMRAWGNRIDTIVVDEPLYPYYLQTTGIDHPAARQIIDAGETSWRRAVEDLLRPLPPDKEVLFQKQMTLHLLDEVDRAWLLEMRNCFLIRDPGDVITSYVEKRSSPSVEDLGVVRQAELYRWLRERTGSQAPVVDARDLQNQPRSILSQLCAGLDLEFDEAMLSWESGSRPTDGLWAPHWYGSVEESTGFEPYRAKSAAVPDELLETYRTCLDAYEELYDKRIQP